MNNTMQPLSQCWAIIPAAGVGRRMQSAIPKQYLEIDGKTLLEHSLSPLLAADWIKGIVVAIASDDPYWKALKLDEHPKIFTATGGKERVDTVRNAVESIGQQLKADDYILVHDAARPCLGTEDLEKLHSAMVDPETDTGQGLLLADKLSDTIKQDDGHSAVLKTVPRDALWRALTPQVFPAKVLEQALQLSAEAKAGVVTDESSAVELLGMRPLLIQGRSDNLKVTKADDLQLASLILQSHNVKGTGE